MSIESPLAWDDLRSALAIARGGSLAAAARSLGVNHSTVFRRLKALEAGLGARLFERGEEGYLPTGTGADLVAVAERVETEIQGLERRLAGRDDTLSGTLRITAPDDLVESLLVEPLAAFSARYPGVRLEIVLDNRMLSLTRREADLAVRPTRDPPENLIGRRIGQIASAVYCAKAAGKNPPRDDTPWIAWDEGSGPPVTTQWMATKVPPEQVVYRSNSLLNLLSACRSGIGQAILPCFLGDPEPRLRRIAEPVAEWHSDLWILTHPDLRHSARVRALSDLLFDRLRAQADLLAGERA